MQIPAEAVRLAAAAIHRDACDPHADHKATGIGICRAVAALEALRDRLARDLLRPLLKRHPRIEGEWGPSCGTCWVKGGGRAAWPCAEVLAIPVLLPVSGDEDGAR